MTHAKKADNVRKFKSTKANNHKKTASKTVIDHFILYISGNKCITICTTQRETQICTTSTNCTK